MQPLLVNAGDLFFVAARGNLGRERFRQQGAKLASNGFLAGYAEELFHARVPGFDDAFQIHGKNANVQRFHDVFAEVLEACDFKGLLLERGVKLGVIECNGNVAGDRFDELNVIAGKIIAVDGLTEPQDSHGVFANAARDKIIEVELVEGALEQTR